jgi:hypothetical protein
MPTHPHRDLADALYAEISMCAAPGATRQSIRAFRSILETAFRHLTLQEKRSFASLFGRMEFVFESQRTDAQVRNRAHDLRRYANAQAHRREDPPQDEWQHCLKTVCETVRHFFGQDVPDTLAQRYEGVGDDPLPLTTARQDADITTLRLSVTAVSAMEGQADGRHFTLHATEEEIGRVRLQLYDGMQGSMSHLQPLLRPHDTLLVTECRKEAEAGNYATTKDSLAILEPDLLMDVSEMANCFEDRDGKAEIFLAGNLVPQSSSIHAFLGTLVNGVLDETIRNPDTGADKATENALRDNFLNALPHGQARISQLLNDIATVHWPNIRSVTRRLRGRPVRIEPSFLSATWGLQGRLDLMVEDDTDALRKDIYELKSGKAPLNGRCKPEHGMQVVGYNMLLESVFGHRRSGTSAVIYSKAETGVERNVTISQTVRWGLLRLRNEVVAGILGIARGDGSALDRMMDCDLSRMQSFNANRIEAFHDAFNGCDTRRRSYYLALLSFLLREYLDMKCGMSVSPFRNDDRNGHAALWLEGLEEKLDGFKAIAGLRFEAFEPERSVVAFAVTAPREHNFRVGDLVVLHGRHGDAPGPLRQQVVKARIEALGLEHIRVSLNNRQLDASHFGRYPEWVIEHEGNERSKWKVVQMLFSVLNGHSGSRFERLAGILRPRFASPPAIDTEGLNDNQAGLIRSALAARDYYLVQGPPGTGKTSTFLTRLVEERLKSPGSIAVAAFTNRAVDEIAQRLAQRGVPFVRLGSRQALAAGLQRHVDALDIDGARGFMASQRVFLSTVATLTSQLDNLRTLKDDIDTLVVDEASQLDEAQLAGLLLSFDKYILIGDQNQLPPIITQDTALCEVTDPVLTEMGMRDLSESVFERLMRNAREKGWHDAYGMLDTQYRMHEDIAALIGPWYGDRLRIGHARQSEPGPGWQASASGPDTVWRDLLLSGRAVFVPSPRRNTPKYHEAEADRIAGLLRYMRTALGDTFTHDSIGVVTPWRTQISKIRERIGRDPHLDDVLIDTVERFQGSEKDHILVSFAVCHPGQMAILRTPGSFTRTAGPGQPDEVEIDRKLLVTLSRARHQVVVFGDEDVLSGEPVWADVIGRMTRHPLPSDA